MTKRQLQLFFLGFLACANAGALAQQRNDLPLPRGPSLELGSVVLLLMPDRNQKRIGWDHRSESKIIWIDNGYARVNRPDGKSASVRRGLVRTNILGKPVTVLRQRREELWWTVTYETSGNERHGPEFIEVSPGTPNETCFGSLYEGCSFEIEPSIRSAGIKLTSVCDIGGGSYKMKGYTVSHPTKAEIQMRVTDSWGSGGASTNIELLYELDKGVLCRGF